MVKFLSVRVSKLLFIGVVVLSIVVILAIILMIGRQINIEIPVLTDKEVESGVRFGDKELGGMSYSDIQKLLNDIADDYYDSGEDAYLDPVTKGVIPGLPEKKLDVEKTKEKLLSAEPGETVKPEYSITPPETNLNDYMDAPIYQGNPEKDQVTFACNVAWGTEYIPSLLELLDRYQIEITFFLEGRWLTNNIDTAKAIKEHGHEIGNHGYHHYMMSELTREEIREEIVKTNEAIEKHLGEEVTLFAPPAGDYDEDVLREAYKLELYTILWSLDTVDWQNPGVDYMEEKILSNVHPGALILMHPTEDTVTALDKILTGLQDKNLQVTTVSELISEDAF